MSRIDLTRRSLLSGSAATVGVGLLGTAAAPALAGPVPAEPAGSPAEALARLLAGNRRFTTGRARHPHQSLKYLRNLAVGQHPFAVTVGCADSRVPPELLFDQGLGDIFDNRVAGTIVDDLMLGSIEFAVEEFGSPLIVVLGHERCGAISAAIEAIETGGTAPGHIGAIVDALRPIVEPVLNLPGDRVDNAVQANIHVQVARMMERSEVIARRVAARELRIVGARYDLENGRVALVR